MACRRQTQTQCVNSLFVEDKDPFICNGYTIVSDDLALYGDRASVTTVLIHLSQNIFVS